MGEREPAPDPDRPRLRRKPDGGLRPDRMRTLQALCDTFVAPVRPATGQAADPTGFWRRPASEVGAPRHTADFLVRRLRPQERAGMQQLIDVLTGMRFADLPAPARAALVRALERVPTIGDGIIAVRKLTMLNTYARATSAEGNPNWSQLGYPGPPAVAGRSRPRLATWRPRGQDSQDELELTCDVVVVGSGAGGAVVAGVVAGSGRDVVVLEAGADRQGADFQADEAGAFDDLFWRGNAVPTGDGTVSILAARSLGGGPTVNWQNCVLPSPAVRSEWTTVFGLDGLDGPDFDAHLDAVTERIGATRDHSDMNGPNQRLREGAEVLGWSWTTALRNVDPDRYDPDTAGHTGFGDRSGGKLGTIETYLADAVAGGARIVTGCSARRVLVERDRATGVDAVLERPGRSPARVTVHARDVVVAAGALETPALLLRSGIGGEATGRHLRLHPVAGMVGIYPQPQESWSGPPQTCIVDEHASDVVDRHGFLVETPHHHLGVVAAALPWRSARDHKLLLGRWADTAVLIAITREHGSGTVGIDGDGEVEVTYPLDDPRDHELLRRSTEAMVRLHAAAGADAVVDLHPSRPLWRRGDDLAPFLARVSRLPFGGRHRPLMTAHQMGTARMGPDASTAVADPDGRLHATRGVWIGDTSAFPTAVGANPMLTCMALARRTALRIVDAGPVR